MACHAEHWFVLDDALSHVSRTRGQFACAGWRAELEGPVQPPTNTGRAR